MLDKNLTMEIHINKIVSHCYKILRDISRIRKYLKRSHLERLVHTVVSSRLDFCNSLFVGITKENKYKLQKVQNAAARLVLGAALATHRSQNIIQDIAACVKSHEEKC